MGAQNSNIRAIKQQENKEQGQEEVQVCNPFFRKLLIQNKGLLNIKLKVPIYDGYSLSLVYTPGVGESCLKIQQNPDDAYVYTNIGNSIAIITDGSDYKYSGHEKFNTDVCIPQLEAQCLFYKVHSNIDAYPFVIDSKRTQTDEETISVLEALQGSFSGVELYNYDTKKLKTLIPKIHAHSNLNLTIITSVERNFIQQRIAERKLEQEFPDGYITTAIFRAALDVRYKGVIPLVLIDLIFNDDLFNFKEKWDTSIQLNKLIVKYFYQNNMQKTTDSEFQVTERYENYMLQGNKGWYIKSEGKVSDSVKETSLELHKRYQGMIKTSSKIKPKSIHKFYDMVRECCYEGLEDEIMENPKMVRELTFKANWCAIITNGTAILGFGDIGATAGLPVMEGKSCIFKQLGGVDVVPMCIQEKDPKKFIDVVMRLAPIFSGINLEDIKAPECFEIEDTLKEKLDIPVFHDDQHGTAIVTGAAVINSLKLMEKQPSEIKLIINGGGAAGLSITQLLLDLGVKNIIICDTKGAIYKGRTFNMNKQKKQLAEITNPDGLQGNLESVLEGADVFIGVSAAGALKPEWIPKMSKKNLVLAMANPVPEILPDVAKKAGVYIMGTGRSDFKNQVNNSLAFPGIFRGALDVQARTITNEMKLAATYAIANLIPEYEISPDYIIPSSLDSRVPVAVSKAVGMMAIKQGIARQIRSEKELELNMRTFMVQRQLINFDQKL